MAEESEMEVMLEWIASGGVCMEQLITKHTIAYSKKFCGTHE
jgi:hypothetical protein